MSTGEGGVARRVPLPDGTYTRALTGTTFSNEDEKPDVVAKVVEPPAKKVPRKTGGAHTK